MYLFFFVQRTAGLDHGIVIVPVSAGGRMRFVHDTNPYRYRTDLPAMVVKKALSLTLDRGYPVDSMILLLLFVVVVVVVVAVVVIPHASIGRIIQQVTLE